MSNRDDFTAPIKRAVALRAGYKCSICSVTTAGPSDDAPDAVAKTGVAAHISAASSGGRRYNPDMTPEERRSINNAIWLCGTHATLIDRDETRFTVERLLEYKRVHEENIKKEMLSPTDPDITLHDLIAIGPEVIAYGEIVSVNGNVWTCMIESYISGSIQDITYMIDNFDSLREDERYILDNVTGDGRSITSPPRWEKRGNDYFVEFTVAPRYLRTDVNELGGDIAIDIKKPDFSLKNGSMHLVEGIDALPQKIALNMWKRLGEDSFSPHYGSRISELFPLYFGTQWLEHVLKLELIRLASIPQYDEYTDNSYTPFMCVNRVISIRLMSNKVANDWIPAHLELDVEGVGRNELDIRLFIPQHKTRD